MRAVGRRDDLAASSAGPLGMCPTENLQSSCVVKHAKTALTYFAVPVKSEITRQ